VPLPCHVGVDYIAFELRANPGGAFGALADEAHATAGQPLNCGHADVFRHATDYDHAFIEIEVHDAAYVVASCVPDSSVMADSAASALRACSSK
jgi:hypothetical protein